MNVFCGVCKRFKFKNLLILSWFSTVLFLGLPSLAYSTPPAEPVLKSGEVDAVFRRFVAGVHKFELSNGLRVLFFQRSHAPIFAGQLWVKVGGVDEQVGSTGLAHFLEHMAFKGTQTIGTKDYGVEAGLLAKLDKLMQSNVETRDKEIQKLYDRLHQVWVDNEYSALYQRHGAMGLNASTGKDYTLYLVELPKTAFEFWCWMESDRLLKPVFRQFYLEREVIQEERRMRTDDNPSGLLYETMLSTAFLTHPNRLPVIGWASDMRQLSTSQMRTFYNRYYRPDNMVLSIVGDLELSEVKQLTEKYFARLPVRKESLSEITTIEPPQRGTREVVIEQDAEPQVMMAYHKPVYPNPADLHFTVLHSLLSDGSSSIMNKELVFDKLIANSVFTTEAPGERYPSVFIVGATPRNGVSVSQLVEEIQTILDRLKTVLVSEKELASAKRRVRVGFLSGLTSNSGLARLLGKSELLHNDWQSFLHMYEIMSSTTAKDIQQLALDYFEVKNRTVAYIKTVREPLNSGSAK